MSRLLSPALLSRRITLILATLTLVALAVTAFGVSTWTRPSSAQSQEETEAPRDARVELFTLTPTGFEPHEVTLPAGDYLLVFNNRTGLDEFALRLDRVGQGRVREAHPPRRKRTWRGMLKLTPGSYTVTETSHPEWSLRLTVTPR